MNKERITSRQAVLILTLFRITLVISYTPALGLPPANQDVWIAVILSVVYSLILRIPILFLANKFSNITMMEYMEIIMGKFIGKLIITIYGVYFMGYSLFTLIIQTQLVGVAILSRTPYWIMMALVIVLSIYICLKGLIVLYWSAEFIIPASLFAIVSLIVLGLKNVDFKLILPILSDSTFLQINQGALMLSFILTDILILVMSVPYLENKKDINKIFIKGSIYSVIIVAVVIIVTQGALGIEQAKHSNYPFLIYTRLIDYSSVFERIDLIFVFTWLSANIGRIIFYMYLTFMAFKHLLRPKNDKLLIYIINTLVCIIALYLLNTGTKVMSKGTLNTILMYVSIIFVTLIPLITMIVYFFRRKSIDKMEKIQKN